MKKLLSILLVLFTFPLFGQDTLYFNSSLKITTADSASYFGFVKADEANPELVTEVLYYLSGEKRSETLYSDYEKDIQSGKQLIWRKNGQLHWERNFKDGELHGTFISYWDNGVIKRKDIYDMGKIVKGWCFTSSGEDTTYYDMEIMPVFPGGIESMYKYISQEIKYPKKARRHGIQGQVIVSFVVNRDGTISDVKVIRGVEVSLDMEAVRVISNMPPWSPAMQDGETVRASFNLPIRYTIR